MNDIIIQYISQKLLSGRADIELYPEDDLLGGGLVDSLGMMNLIAFVENEFEITIPPEDLTIENFMTVESIGNYVTERKQN